MTRRHTAKKYLFTLCVTVLLLLCLALPVSAANDNCDYLTQTNVTPLHEMGITGKYEDGTPVRVVVIDSGIDYRNEAFTDEDGNCIISPLSYNASTKQTVADYGYEVIDDQEASEYHGTAVCGTIVSRLDSAPGVAPDAEMVVVRCNYNQLEGGVYSFSASDLYHALEYAVSINPAVISISWQLSDMDGIKHDMADLLQTAWDNNILVCTAAGNDGCMAIKAPADNETVLCIGAVDHNNNLTNYSNYGSLIDLVAPGNVLAVRYGAGVRNIEGTSFSTPIVAGIGALYISMHPDATAEEIVSALCSTAQNLGVLGRDDTFGYGIPDAFAACWSNKASLTLICEDHQSTLSYFPGSLEALNAIIPTTNGGIFTGWYYDEAFTQPVGADDVFWHDTTLYGGIQYTWTLYDGYVNVLASVTDYPGAALSYPERAGFIRWTEDEMSATLGRGNANVHLFWILMDLDVQSTPTDVTAKTNTHNTDTFTFSVSHPLADQITYVWMRDGMPLTTERTSTLSLAQSQENSGVYTCVATLLAGGQTRTASCSFTVSYTKPSRMPIVIAAAIAICPVFGAIAYRKRKKKHVTNNV